MLDLKIVYIAYINQILFHFASDSMRISQESTMAT